MAEEAEKKIYGVSELTDIIKGLFKPFDKIFVEGEISGWKIYPTEVESVLLNHPLVLEAAVFGIPDIHRTEIPVAAVVLRNKECSDQEKEKASAELEKYCRENLAVYKVPRKFFFIDELPRVNGWKLLRRDLQKRFGNVS